MIKRKSKAFSVIEFLIASVLTVGVVGSSTVGIGLAEKIQRETYYNDVLNQVGNSLIQGTKALNCGVEFTTKTRNACKAIFTNNGYVEINSAAPVPPIGSSPSEGMWFPFTDGTYKYTLSSNFKLNIKVATTWLEAGKTDSCVQAGFSPTEYPQPNMILRTITITGIAGSRSVKTKVFNDLQTVSSSVKSIVEPSDVTYSASVSSLTPGVITKAEFVGTTNTTVYRYNDWKGCAWFPFISQGASTTIATNTIPGNSVGRVNV